MRFIAPTKGQSGRAALSTVPEDAATSATTSNTLATVVANRMLRSYETPLDLIGNPPSASIMNAPKKTSKPQPTIGSESEQTPFYEWYDALTIGKQKALMESMVNACEERKPRGGSGASATTRRNRTTLDEVFEWHVEQDQKTLLLQFKRWFSSLDEVQQNTALAYTILTDPDFKWEEQAQLRRSARCSTRAKTAKRESVAGKESSQLLSWAQGYVEHSTVVMPYMPEEVQIEELQEELHHFSAIGYPLPEPPVPGYRAKVTREGTLVLDDVGQVVFERMSRNVRSAGRKGKARAY
ncbi:hypothetical protein L218DRAFT_967036 [Marasmius fiardii PR-910]|nr:hypothetical protein L218DRAFT_967036 [Marasmius fiardii PR-910]